MQETFDLIIEAKDALLSHPQKPQQMERRACHIGIRKGRIAAIADHLEDNTSPRWSAGTATVLPGLIDSQVHFRDPGNPEKEDFASGTKGAILGGITAVFDMPNTKPNTSTKQRFLEKLEAVRKKSYCDFALFAGATNDNSQELVEMENLEGCCGIKIFMGSSTGDLLVAEDEFLARVLAAGKKMISVHCEDEATLKERFPIAEKAAHPRAHPDWRNVESALRATQRIVSLARKAGRRIHALHITTAEEIDFLKQNKDIASVEILPQHLYFSAPECYERLGSFAQMNPPIREQRHQEALKKAIQNRIVDVVASDHAPHTRAEKAKVYPQSPSGLTGVQTIVPLMLNFVNQGLLSLEHLVELMCLNPARIFKIQGKGGIMIGHDADFTVVDMNRTETVTNEWIASRSGWSPYAGERLKGWPVATFIRGNKVMENGQVLAQLGEPLRFS